MSSLEESEKYLIVGLGNPGKEYEQTRHNIGFAVVDHLAEKWKVTFSENRKMLGKMAQAVSQGKKVYILKPTTYMNLSGRSVQSAYNYFGVELSHLLVVVDDVYLPLGEMRMRIDSGSGGHHGLDDVEKELGTKEYARLRVGVGNPAQGELGDYVLEKFTKEESRLLPQVIEKAVQVIELWLCEGLVPAMNTANVRVKKKVEEQNIGECP